MATTYTLPAGGALVPITEAGIPGGCVIANTGANPADLFDNGSAVAADAWPLGAGDTFTWDTRPLWASSSSGTTVVVDDNAAGQLFSSQAVASALLSSGLADDIAQRIEVRGAPTIDAPKVVALQTTNVPAGNFGGFYDVTGYNSLTAYINITAPSGAGAGDIPEVSLTFTNQGYFQGSSPMVVQGHQSCQMMITLPITGSGVTLAINAPAGYQALGYLTASYRPIQARAFVVKNAAWASLSGVSDRMWDTRATSYFLSIAAGGTGTFYPSYASSPTQWSRFVAAATASGTDHYLLSEIAGASSWAPLAGDYAVTVANQIRLDTDLFFGSAQPLLYIANHNTAAIKATGFLGSLE